MNSSGFHSLSRPDLYASPKFSTLYQTPQTITVSVFSFLARIHLLISLFLRFQLRFITALKGTAAIKFVELSSLIQEGISSNNKELHSCYSLLIENLFAFGNQEKENNLNLMTVASPAHVPNQNHIFSFMHPEGPLFNLIRHLMCDHLFRYEFPGNCLPVSRHFFVDYAMVSNFFLYSPFHPGLFQNIDRRRHHASLLC